MRSDLVRGDMARKTQSRPWLQVFQKPKSVSELENDLKSDSAVLLEENPHAEEVRSSEVLEPLEPEADAAELHDPLAEPEELEGTSQNRLIPVQKTVAAATKITRSTARKLSSATKATAQRMSPFVKAWKWQLIWLGILGVFGGTAGLAFLWLSQVPPAVDCQRVNAWSLESEQLFCAQEAARSGKPEAILSAINLVKNWTTEHPLYAQSQLLLQDWSNALLILARDRVAQRDVKGAVELANQVPKNSPVYKEAQTLIDRWQAEHRRAQRIYDKLQEALKKQNWNLSSDLMAQLSLVDDPGWQDRLGEIREQINTEQAGWKNLIEARKFAKANPPERLGQAIALTDPINRKTYIWTLQAQQEVIRWRNTIFSLAIARLDKNDIAGASSLINSVPASVQLTTANRDFIRLIRGKEAIASDDYKSPTLDRVVPLMMATHLVRQINESSPFFSRAKALIPRLEQQLQDLTQLGIASNLANLQQLPTLQMAIAQARSISPKRPGRLHAQTLLAQWQKELQWMEDRPLLTRARQVAKSGKLDSLRSAVAMANLIRPRRALRVEAQTDAANWIYQIQVLEDRPIIAEARSIANAGQLGQAIEVASRIRPGRALYGEAQGLIGEWVYQIQLAEDRSTIAQATNLAAGGYLTRAIEVASTISRGRPLYGEARGLISQWAAERAEIWRQRDQQVTPVPDDQDSSIEPEPQADPFQSEPAPPEASPEPTPP